MPDPRRVRGRRYRLGLLLALCLTTVLGEARSLAQTARCAADTHPEVRAGLDPDSEAVRGSRTGSNEIPTFAPLLARFDLRGVIVTADGMHAQRKTATSTFAAGGHYLLVVKGNQEKLRRQLRRRPWQ
ncbi:hypothetical protein [Streptomyces mirabilis]|uniref:hypothetical protein n=1 Tax=Streptomyces mirabilis TaxID=68239 RepID=UPI003688563E